MNQMNRVYMAASVAVVNTHAYQARQKLRSARKSFDHAKKLLLSGGQGPDADCFRPFSGVMNSNLGGHDEKKKDESIRQVMYFNCWGQG